MLYDNRVSAGVADRKIATWSREACELCFELATLLMYDAPDRPCRISETVKIAIPGNSRTYLGNLARLSELTISRRLDFCESIERL